VDKPVIESELLAALQQQLQLEWVAELAVPAWTEPEAGAPLPGEAARRLLPLARLGHRQGLVQALERLGDELPSRHATTLAALRQLVQRGAYAELLRQLQATLAADEADEDDDTEDGDNNPAAPATEPVNENPT
jgi:hypothetical protein